MLARAALLVCHAQVTWRHAAPHRAVSTSSRLPPPIRRHTALFCAAAPNALPPAPVQKILDGPAHLATIAPSTLLADCEIKHTKGSGPGGQHRNKVQTAVVVKHVPTEVVASASESRSQQQNQVKAIQRLRVKLALLWRSPPPENANGRSLAPSKLWTNRARGGKVSVNEAHQDFPAILSEALDAIWVLQDVKGAADALGVSTSQMVKLLAKEPAALRLINDLRASKGMPALRVR